MPSNHLILCRPLLLLPSVFPSIRVFSNEWTHLIRWPSGGASASTSVLPMNTQEWSPLGFINCYNLFIDSFRYLRYITMYSENDNESDNENLCLVSNLKGKFSMFYLLLFNLLVFFFSFFLICSEFCHTLDWNSHGFTCVPHPDPPSHLPLHPLPLGFPSAPGPSTCLMHPTWAGDLFHPRCCTCFDAVLLKHPTLAFSHRV